MRDAVPAALASVLDAEIGGAMAWTRAALGPGAGRVALTAEGLAEIDAAVDLMRATLLPALALSPRDFPLPALRRTMAEVKRALDTGVGFALLAERPRACGRGGSRVLSGPRRMISRPRRRAR
jgi:hypothetical protein